MTNEADEVVRSLLARSREVALCLDCAAVARLAAEGRTGLRGAVRPDEAPAELTAADLVLGGPAGVPELLRRLA